MAGMVRHLCQSALLQGALLGAAPETPRRKDAGEKRGDERGPKPEEMVQRLDGNVAV